MFCSSTRLSRCTPRTKIPLEAAEAQLFETCRYMHGVVVSNKRPFPMRACARISKSARARTTTPTDGQVPISEEATTKVVYKSTIAVLKQLQSFVSIFFFDFRPSYLFGQIYRYVVERCRQCFIRSTRWQKSRYLLQGDQFGLVIFSTVQYLASFWVHSLGYSHPHHFQDGKICTF